MTDTNIDNSNIDSLQEGKLCSSEINLKKVNFKDDVITNPYENDDFWNDCQIEDNINDKNYDKNDSKEQKVERTDKHIFSNPISAKESLNNFSNLFYNSIHESSPKNHSITNHIHKKKITCLKCSKKEEKKKAFNNSFTNDSSTNTYIFSQNKQINELHKYKQSLMHVDKIKIHNRSISEGPTNVKEMMIGNEGYMDKNKSNKSSHKSVENYSMNERVQNSSLVDLNKRNRELETKIHKINKNKVNNLYLSSIKLKEKKEYIIKEHEKLKSEKEMKDCTFKPKVNSHYNSRKTQLIKNETKINEEKEGENKGKNAFLDAGFLERGNAWQSKKNEKFENFKNYLVKEEHKICTFQPNIRKKSLPNYDKAELDVNSLRYLERLHRAKLEKQEKIDKLNPNINEIYEKVFKKQKLSKFNCQQKEEEYCTFNPNKKKIEFEFVKSLRNQLHEINLNEIQQ